MKLCQVYGYIIVIKDYAENKASTSLKIKSQHWGGGNQLSMESVALDFFNNNNIVIEVYP